MCELSGFADSASAAADSAKKRYVWGVKVELICLVLAALFQILPSDYFSWLSQKSINISTVIFTGSAIFIALLIKAIHLEDIWQESRTLSESAKKLSWFYIMKISPFTDPDQTADSEFVLGLERIREQSNLSKNYLAANTTNNDLITAWMRTQRGKTYADRKDLYLAKRINPQVDWYCDKATANSKGESMSFILTLVFEIAAFFTGILLLTNNITNISVIGLLTTLAASTVAWGKIQRHKQLAISYSVISQQIKSQKSMWTYVSSEDMLKSEVEKTEELISRENTNWMVIRS